MGRMVFENEKKTVLPFLVHFTGKDNGSSYKMELSKNHLHVVVPYYFP